MTHGCVPWPIAVRATVSRGARAREAAFRNIRSVARLLNPQTEDFPRWYQDVVAKAFIPAICAFAVTAFESQVQVEPPLGAPTLSVTPGYL